MGGDSFFCPGVGYAKNVASKLAFDLDLASSLERVLTAALVL